MNGSWHVCVGSILEPPILFLSRVELVLSIRTKNRKKLNLDKKKGHLRYLSPLFHCFSGRVQPDLGTESLSL